MVPGRCRAFRCTYRGVLLVLRSVFECVVSITDGLLHVGGIYLVVGHIVGTEMVATLEVAEVIRNWLLS